MTDASATPTRAYRPLDVDAANASTRRGVADDDSVPDGSGTPGSPTRIGSRTRWTKDDASASTSGGGGGDDASVMTQVTRSGGLERPKYGRDNQPQSFKRPDRIQSRSDAAAGGARREDKKSGGGGWFAALFCCGKPRDDDDSPRQQQEALMPPKRAAPRGGPRAVHVGDPFIGPALSSDRGKPCLVLDLDETLVHSSFKPVTGADYIVPVEIDGSNTDVYVLKRPWVDYFMEEMGKYYEIVVFTASLSKYADPLLDLLDVGNVIRWRLFREHCYPYQGNYVKDLTSLGRPMHKTIIIDNSPHSYAFQPQNALPVSSFIDDPRDDDLLDLIPILIDLAKVANVENTLVENDGFVPRRSWRAATGQPQPTQRRLR